MPRKTKDSSLEEEKKVTKKASVKSTKKTAKSSSTKSSTSKKTTTKKPTTETKKVSSKTTSKKATVKKGTVKKTTAKKKSITTKKVTEHKYINEYYDLPYRYNQTIVRILAQTPKMLFVYWDISDVDRKNFEKNYGENFFNATKPVLIIHNKTLDYSFEVDINDFANSWYLHVNDANCEYNIELGRRPISSANNNSVPDYIYISSSNDMEAPNNKVLFNPSTYKTIYFRNVKTNQIIAKSIFDFPFIANIKNIGEFYNVYDLYKKLYKYEDLNFINNPSSGATSSMFSSQFK